MTQTVIELRAALEELKHYLPAHYSGIIVERLPNHNSALVRKVKSGHVHNVDILIELIKLAKEQRELAQSTAP